MKLAVKGFKGLYAALAGLGIVGVVLIFCLAFASIGVSIYGLILAFKASIVLGIVSLFVEPAFFIYGVVMLFGESTYLLRSWHGSSTYSRRAIEMGRSGELRALNDDLVRQLLLDPLYDVRPDGTIWTLKAKRGNSIGAEWRKAGRYESNGYVQISYRGKRLLAHRIVYQRFNGSLQSDLIVDHKNEVRDDNRPDNLQLATARSNRRYMERRKEEECTGSISRTA